MGEENLIKHWECLINTWAGLRWLSERAALFAIQAGNLWLVLEVMYVIYVLETITAQTQLLQSFLPETKRKTNAVFGVWVLCLAACPSVFVHYIIFRCNVDICACVLMWTMLHRSRERPLRFKSTFSGFRIFLDICFWLQTIQAVIRRKETNKPACKT